MHLKKDGFEYWVFPGGGLEDTDKSDEDGLLREIEEETTLKVFVNKLIYTHDYTTSTGLYYLCDHLSGEAKLGESIEKKRVEEGKNDTYDPVWIDINSLPTLLVYPLEIRDWIIEDIKNDFADTPRIQKIETKDLRKE